MPLPGFDETVIVVGPECDAADCGGCGDDADCDDVAHLVIISVIPGCNDG